MLECRRFKNQISQYIDKELNNKDLDLFEKHIGTCEECRKELQEMLSIVSILQSTEEQDLPEGFRPDFHRRLVEESGKPAGKKKIIGNFGKYAAILSSAAAVLLIAFFFKGVWSNMLDNKSASEKSPVALSKAQANADEKMNNDNSTAKKLADNYKADNSTEIQIDSSEYSNNAGIITYDTQPTEKKDDSSAAGISEKPERDGNQETANSGDNLKAAAVPAVPSAKNTQDADTISGTTYSSTGVAITHGGNVNRNTSEVIMSGMGADDQTENIKRLVADCGGEIVATTVSTTFAAKSVSSDSAEKVVNVKVKNSQYGTLVEQLKAKYGSENLIITEVNHEDNTKKVDELNTTLKNLDSSIAESQKNGALPDSKELQDLNNQKAAVSKEIKALIDDSDYTYIAITIKNVKQ